MSKNTTIVSVIMNCFNGERYLREAIDSVYAQTHENWEIIFWDNCSFDQSAIIAQSYDSKLKYFFANKTTPLGEARNLALKKINGEFVAFLDADDYWDPFKLEKQLSLFKDRYVGLVYTDTNVIYDEKVIKRFYKNFKPPQGYVFAQVLGSYFLVLSSVMIFEHSGVQIK